MVQVPRTLLAQLVSPTDANVPNWMVNGMGVRLMHFIRSYIDLLVHGVCEYDVDLLVEAAAGP